MEPYIKKTGGRELGNAAAAAAICGIRWDTYQWYIRTNNPQGNPPPGHVEIDNATGFRMYPLKDVRAWMKSRKGRGNWGGEGARAREKFRDQDAKRYDEIEREAGVTGEDVEDDDPAAEQETAEILADAVTMAAAGEARAESA